MDDIVIEAHPESIIPNNDLYNCLLNFSGLNRSGCYGIAHIYPAFVFLLIICINVNFIFFDFHFNPFDIAKSVYYFFFIIFFVFARFCYNIIEHYKTLIKIIPPDNRGKIVNLIRKTTLGLSGIGISYWGYDTYRFIENTTIQHTALKIPYIIGMRCAYLYLYAHIICYIVNLCFVFKIHKYQLDEFKRYIQRDKFNKVQLIKEFRKIKKDIRYSERVIGPLLNLGMVSTLFRFPLDMIEIVYDHQYIHITTFIGNSVCFLVGLSAAAKLNDYNECFITKLYKNEYIREKQDMVEYCITFFNNNKVYFRIINTAPNSKVLSKMLLILLNVAGSLLSGLLSKN